jgi:hypothetical protein
LNITEFLIPQGHLTYLSDMEPKRVLQVTRAAEKFWLASSIIVTSVSLWIIYSEGWEKNKMLPLVPALAWLWYFVRRGFRKRLQNDMNSNKSRN